MVYKKVVSYGEMGIGLGTKTKKKNRNCYLRHHVETFQTGNWQVSIAYPVVCLWLTIFVSQLFIKNDFFNFALFWETFGPNNGGRICFFLLAKSLVFLTELIARRWSNCATPALLNTKITNRRVSAKKT